MTGLRTLAIAFAFLASTSVLAEDIPFSVSDFAAYVGDGPATVDGEAFLTTEGGAIKTCAGSAVYLLPSNKYDVEVITSWGFTFSLAMRQAGPAAKYWRETACDSQGKFSFEDIPLGEWIVIADVTWLASNRQNQGGLMGKKVSVRGKKNKVMLTAPTLKANKTLFVDDWPK